MSELSMGRQLSAQRFRAPSPLDSMEPTPHKQVLGPPNKEPMESWKCMKLELLRIYLADKYGFQEPTPTLFIEGSYRTAHCVIQENLGSYSLRNHETCRKTHQNRDPGHTMGQ